MTSSLSPVRRRAGHLQRQAASGARNETTSVFDQRHIGRLLRSSCNSPGRSHASSRGRKHQPGRCPAPGPSDLRIDGGRVAATGAGGSAARMDGALRSDDRRGEEVCSVEHPAKRRLERGARALGNAVRQLKREPGKGLLTGGLKLPLALAELGLIDEYEFLVQPRIAGHGPTLFAGLSKYVDLKLVSRQEFGSGTVAMRYEPNR